MKSFSICEGAMLYLVGCSDTVNTSCCPRQWREYKAIHREDLTVTVTTKKESLAYSKGITSTMSSNTQSNHPPVPSPNSDSNPLYQDVVRQRQNQLQITHSSSLNNGPSFQEPSFDDERLIAQLGSLDRANAAILNSMIGQIRNNAALTLQQLTVDRATRYYQQQTNIVRI